MYRIALCDDVADEMEILSKYISSFFENIKKPYHIKRFSEGTDIIDQCLGYDIVFLDILMPNTNGIDVGRKIKEINPSCYLIMSTGSEDYYQDAFKIEAFRYIRKPFSEDDINEALCKIISKKPETILLYYNRMRHEVKRNDISYVRSINGCSEFWVKNRYFRNNQTINDTEKELGKDSFFRIHKQYIINMGSVTDVKGNYVYLGNDRLPISARRRKQFENALVEYDLGHSNHV